MHFLITYDLINEADPQEYEELESGLRSLGAVPVQFSVWHLERKDGEYSCKSLVNYLNKFMKLSRGDRLIVGHITDWAGFNNWDDGPE